MKKAAIGSFLLAALLLVSCKAFGPAGNPVALTGTWNGATVSFSTVTPEKVTQTSSTMDYEGTWQASVVVPPQSPLVETDATTGITTTTHSGTPELETTTTTTTYNLVVTADGSAVFTITRTYNQAARDAIAAVSSGTTQNNASAAVTAGTATITTVYTYTVTDIGTVYRQAASEVQSVVATGALVGVTYTLRVADGTNQTVTMSGTAQSTSYAYDVTNAASNTSLAFYDIAGGAAGLLYDDGTVENTPSLEQTVFGTTPTADYQNRVDAAYAFVVAEDGTYTFTTTVTTTQTARDAIAGSATVAPSAAVLAGTTVQTTVQTGTLTSAIFSGDQYADFVPSSSTVTRSGTGALVSPDYPATEVTSSGYVEAYAYRYSIVEGKDATWLTLQTSDTYMGQTYLALLKAAT